MATSGNVAGPMSIRMDVSDVLAHLDTVDAECRAAARPAAQAGAQVLYDAVKANVAGMRKGTGNLSRAIYQAFSKDNSSTAVAQYHISWNARKAPHGHLVEWGHLIRYEVSFDPVTGRFTTHKDRPLPVPRQVAARPFVRPAAAKFPQANEAMRKRYLEDLVKRGILT